MSATGQRSDGGTMAYLTFGSSPTAVLITDVDEATDALSRAYAQASSRPDA